MRWLGHAEVAAVVLDKFADLLKGGFVEKKLQPLAGGELAFRVLSGAALVAASCFRLRSPAAEFFEFFFKFQTITL